MVCFVIVYRCLSFLTHHPQLLILYKIKSAQSFIVENELIRRETLAAMLLEHVATLARAHDKANVDSLVLVAPLDASPSCILALYDATRIAGLKTLAIIRDIEAGWLKIFF